MKTFGKEGFLLLVLLVAITNSFSLEHPDFEHKLEATFDSPDAPRNGDENKIMMDDTSDIANLYPLSGQVHSLETNKPLRINVRNEGVPQNAYEVIVYATVRTGRNIDINSNGELVVSVTIPNGRIERKLFLRVYDQGSWSYNSENIALLVGPGSAREIVAELKAAGDPVASIQIVGYRQK